MKTSTMKEILRFAVPIGFAVAAVLALSAAHGQQSQSDAQKRVEREQWVGECLKDFQGIKKGMTRAAVEARFITDGGLNGASQVRYVHPQCSHFKIDVDFEVKRDVNDHGRAITGKDDKVTGVSRPYIEPSYTD